MNKWMLFMKLCLTGRHFRRFVQNQWRNSLQCLLPCLSVVRFSQGPVK